MKTRCVISFMVVAAFMLMSQPALADDLADLKATNETLDKLWNAGDYQAAFEYLDDRMTNIGPRRGFPRTMRGKAFKAMVMKGFAKWYETHTYRLMWYKPDYRVIGNMGLVWGVGEEQIKSKNGPTKRFFLKISRVFVKSEGKWKQVLSHYTPIPSTQTLY